MVKTSKVMQFGNCQFSVKAQNDELVANIESLFPAVRAEELATHQLPAKVVMEELCTGQQMDGKIAEELESLTITGLLNHLYARHEGCLWISSATLCTPDGKLVLLVGPSYAGKTTLALAMAFLRNWKIISQDITLIDPALNVVLPCPAPINMREGTRKMLAELCNLPEIASGPQGWSFDQALYLTQPVPAKYTTALCLMPFDQNSPDTVADLVIEPLSVPEFIRALLSLSNLLRLADRVSVLQDAVQEAGCFQLSGGKLKQRVELLESLVRA